jgi:hypothetical protein
MGRERRCGGAGTAARHGCGALFRRRQRQAALDPIYGRDKITRFLAGGRIAAIYIALNPEKRRHIFV